MSFITYLLQCCQENFVKLKFRDYLDSTTLFMENFFTEMKLAYEILLCRTARALY
jgi:hypothetical protein